MQPADESERLLGREEEGSSDGRSARRRSHGFGVALGLGVVFVTAAAFRTTNQRGFARQASLMGGGGEGGQSKNSGRQSTSDMGDLFSSVKIHTDSSLPMSLHAIVSYEMDEQTLDTIFRSKLGSNGTFAEMFVETAVRFYPMTGSTLAKLWSISGVSNVESGFSQEATLTRLRANTEYTAELWVRISFSGAVGLANATASLRWSGSWLTSKVGYERFDSGPFLDIEGNQPSFELVSFAAMGEVVPRSHQSKVFNGLVACDAEGYIVYAYPLYLLESWDRMPDGSNDILLQSDSDGRATRTWTEATNEPNAHEQHWESNSQLQHISPLGELKYQYISGCTGHPMNFNKITHECRADPASADYDVLTLRYTVQQFPGTNVSFYKDPSVGVYTGKEDYFFGTEIVRWNRQSNVIEPLYNMFDLVDPRMTMFPFSWNSLTGSCNPNEPKISGIEYHHVSSVSVSAATGDFIVASREFSTVWCLARNGSGLVWTVSSISGIPSDYAFVNQMDTFSSPHDVLQLANGDLLVVDDGTGRDGCSEDITVNCFSRALQYAFDGEHIRVVWQFEYPLALNSGAPIETVMAEDYYNFDGGSVVPLSSSTFLWGLTSMSSGLVTHNENLTSTAYMLELDIDMKTAQQMVRSKIRVPIPHKEIGKQNGYRFVPWTTVNGESETAPFDFDDEETSQ